MGIIREPEGVEFTVVPTPLSVSEASELSAIIAKSRQDPVQIESARQAQEILARYNQRQHAADRIKIEAAAIALPATERVQLVHRLIDSLTPSDSPPVSLAQPMPKAEAIKTPTRRRISKRSLSAATAKSPSTRSSAKKPATSAGAR